MNNNILKSFQLSFLISPVKAVDHPLFSLCSHSTSHTAKGRCGAGNEVGSDPLTAGVAKHMHEPNDKASQAARPGLVTLVWTWVGGPGRSSERPEGSRHNRSAPLRPCTRHTRRRCSEPTEETWGPQWLWSWSGSREGADGLPRLWLSPSCGETSSRQK